MLFEIENLSKTLGNKLLIKNFSTRLLQQDKIAIVGKNGTGKSTFLRILLKDMEADDGMLKIGDFSIGYFDQHRTTLSDDKTLLETFCPRGGDRVEVWGKNMHVFGYLKNFLFPKEHLDKKIGVLSGGEKNRVALALLFTKKVDCLILDEPTNDLDIPTINILEENLQKFEGAVIFVSHDRYFVDKISKKLFIFKGEGVVEESYQSYSEYLEIEREIRELEEFGIENAKEIKIVEKPKKVQTKLSYKEQRELEMLPLQIDEYESKIEELNNCLSNPACYEKRGIVTVSQELEQLKNEYEVIVERYLELEEKAEELKNG
jgi:ATP-binding cassette subfamily F protein uup